MRFSDRYLPPGVDARGELARFAAFGFVFLLCWSLSFLPAYVRALNALYTYEYGRRVLQAGAVMQDLGSLMRLRFAGFWGYALCCLGTAAGHYRSFTRETKSIYVMKRLKSAREMHVRCLALPAAALLAGAALTALLMLAYTLLYRFATPEACLPASVGFDFWGALL